MRLVEMAAHLIAISEFPKDNRIWRVEYELAVQENPQVPSEPTIQVVIARFKPEVEQQYRSNPYIRQFYSTKDVDQIRVINIGIGHLSLIKIGSL